MTQEQQALELQRLNVIDGRIGSGVRRTSILIEGDRLRLVGDAEQGGRAAAPPRRFQASEELWAIPGLINCHDHLMNKSLRKQPTGTTANVSVSAWRMKYFLASPGFQALECIKNAQDQLRQGVTTVRELAGPAVKDIQEPAFTNVDLRDAIAGGLMGPRILACRLAVGMTGGHGFPWYALRQADGEAEVRKAVREQLRGHADCIKVMASGGFSNYPKESPEVAELSVDELTAAAEEAHRGERLITAHAIANRGIVNAVEAGIDTIEHGFLIEQETVQLMAEQGTSFVPTVTVIARMAAGQGALAAYTKPVLERHIEAVNRALKLGIDVGVGTDSRPTMLDEMQNLVDVYGLSVETVLAGATSTAARICGLSDLGVIADGMRADLVLLGRNPYDGLKAAFSDVRAVFKNGELLYSTLPELEESHAHHGP